MEVYYMSIPPIFLEVKNFQSNTSKATIEKPINIIKSIDRPTWTKPPNRPNEFAQSKLYTSIKKYMKSSKFCFFDMKWYAKYKLFPKKYKNKVFIIIFPTINLILCP